MKTHDEMVTEWQEDPAFRNAYDALAEEFALFDALFRRVRRRASRRRRLPSVWAPKRLLSRV